MKIPAPADAARQQPADERSDRDRAAHGGAPRRDRLATRRTLEILGDEGETGREHRCAADALKGA